MSDELKHECGIAHIRLLKSLDFYKKKNMAVHFMESTRCIY